MAFETTIAILWACKPLCFLKQWQLFHFEKWSIFGPFLLWAPQKVIIQVSLISCFLWRASNHFCNQGTFQSTTFAALLDLAKNWRTLQKSGRSLCRESQGGGGQNWLKIKVTHAVGFGNFIVWKGKAKSHLSKVSFGQWNIHALMTVSVIPDF